MNFKRNERDLKQIRGKQINVIGITGGIGSGKSTVCRMFAELGVAVYDSDAEARGLMTGSSTLPVISPPTPRPEGG